MTSADRLRDIRNLQYLLFGGLSEEEFYSRPRPSLPQTTGEVEVTGHAEMDLRTGDITCYSARTKSRSSR